MGFQGGNFETISGDLEVSTRIEVRSLVFGSVENKKGHWTNIK